MAKAVKYLEGLTIHKVPYNIANTSDFKTNVMGKAADNELFIITDTPTFSLKIGNVTYDGTSNVSAIAATQSSDGLMSASDKSKLNGIASEATKTIIDTSLSGTSTNPVQNKIIKSALDGKASTAVATTNTNGLMSAADKKKLDDIATGANKTIVDATLSDSSTNPVQNKIIKSALDGKASTAVATQSANGLMSASDKTKLDGIATGANKTIVDSTLSSSSTNPVQNKAVNAALSGKASTAVATTSANGLMSASDKTKLNGIATGANKTTVDSALSTTSTNPVENKVVKAALDSKLNTSGGTLTGNLTGQYLTGTWLQTTEATDLGRTPGKIAVLDDSGWVYYRTPAEIKTDISVDTQTIIDTIYPIGSIYITLNQTSPSKLFPGTYWKQIKNRFLLSASSTYSATSVGGEATHALTENEIPEHQHSIWFPNPSGSQSAAIGYPEAGSKNTWYAEASKTSSAGGGAAHNNMPPYLAVYMWERVYKAQTGGSYQEDVYFLYGQK